MTLPKPAEQMVPSPMVTQTCSHTMVTQVTWGASVRLLEMIVEETSTKYYLGPCRTLGATSLRGLQRPNFLLHIPRQTSPPLGEYVMQQTGASWTPRSETAMLQTDIRKSFVGLRDDRIFPGALPTGGRGVAS